MALKAAVIGGGISGLASASRLAGLGLDVTLFEGDDGLGGLATTFPWRAGHLERFYHCILPTDHALLGWIRTVGLEPELLWKRVTMGFTYRGRTYPMATPLDLLRFSPLTIPERLRLARLGLLARRRGADAGLDAITAERWVRDVAGDRVFEILWRPLLEAKIGDGYPGIPALWLASRLSREKNAGPEIKGCLKRGYRSLIDAFESHLRGAGVSIRLRTAVATLEPAESGLTVALAGGGRERFDLVVSTLPLVMFQRMTQGLGIDPALRDLALDYQGVVSGVFLTRMPLTHHYWMPVVDSGLTAQGLIAMSNLVPLERSDGLHVNYLMNYTHRDSALFQASDREMMATYRKDLDTLAPGASAGIVDAFLFRAPFVEPIWSLHFAAKRPPTRVLARRLYLACTAQVYPEINSWNSCARVVERMVPEIAADLGIALPAAGAPA